MLEHFETYLGGGKKRLAYVIGSFIYNYANFKRTRTTSK